MNITLKQAHRLDNEIDSKIQSIFQKQSVRTNGNYGVSIHQSLNEFIESTRKEIDETIVDTFALVQLRYTLRELIASSKTSSGLSQLLTKEAGAKDLLGRLNLLAKIKVLTPSEMKIAVAKHEALQHGKVSDTYSSRDSIGIEGILTQEKADYFDTTIRQIKKDLVSYADQSAAINNTATVTLSTVMIETLNKYKLL